jgi:hypothetical protein
MGRLAVSRFNRRTDKQGFFWRTMQSQSSTLPLLCCDAAIDAATKRKIIMIVASMGEG